MTDGYVAASDRYQQLGYRRVGRSGLDLPVLSLGLWQNFGDGHRPETQRATLLRAFDLGVTHFDLANNYGPPPGAAEERLGVVLGSDLHGYRDELVISTKAGYGMWPGRYGDGGSRKYLLASLDQSLARTGLEYFDIFYSHRFDPATPLAETMGALHTAVTSGKALYAGVSNYPASQTREAARILAGMGTPLLIHQPSYSMFNRHVELVGAGQDESLLDAVGDLGIGMIVFSPLAQGLLTSRYLSGAVPADSRAAAGDSLGRNRISATYLERAKALDGIARGRGQSLAQLALSWVLRDPRVTSAVIGASSVGQLEENLSALAAGPLTADELAAIEPYAVDGTA